MKDDIREPAYEVIAVRVPVQLASRIKTAARLDDRTLSGYLRRLLASTVPPREGNRSTGRTASLDLPTPTAAGRG